MTPVPLRQYLSQLIAAAGKTNVEIAEALGYPRSNVIAMLKTGSMKLPLDKVGPMARVLGIDPVHLLDRILAESSPNTWAALREVLGNRLVTDNEYQLVEFVRGHVGGYDPRLTEFDDFRDVLAPELTKIAHFERQRAEASSARRSEPTVEGGFARRWPYKHSP
ncbi:MAG: helix-turn-helix transcriptional regulator [Burkholderiales bacterium]|nr:helix-turn-helix transcriptional regulator [Burkholderiales bacterium]